MKVKPRVRLLQVAVGLVGVIMSVGLHELFHVLVHWGDIASIHLFPDRHAIVEIVLRSPHDFDLRLEEMAAYSITFLVLVITIAAVNRLGDRASEKSFSQLLFPDEVNPRELVELAYHSQLLR